MYEKLEVLTDALSLVGEGPLWLAGEKKIAYVDIRGKTVRKLNPQNGAIRDSVYPQMIAFLVETEQGELLCGAQDGVYRLEEAGGFIRVSRPFVMKGERFNDGKVGPDGRLYMGTIGSGQTAALYRMDGQGAVVELFDGVGNSNGLDWDEKRGIFYYNDTRTHRTDAFDFCASDGTLANRRSVITYENGVPDGMCIDEDGNLWTALWGGGRVVCVNPQTGRMIRDIVLPVSQPSCCCFWGDALDNLAITSAAAGRPLGDEPLAGALFTVRPGVRGTRRYRLHL